MPEAVELPGRKVRKGDKVRVLPPRGERRTVENDRLWRVTGFEQRAEVRTAKLAALDDSDVTTATAAEDLVVVAEFRDAIYPGLVSTGKVERGGDKPFHTVINAENFHALQTLLFTHRGKVDCIYIDPPYNTGAKDWKYNNDYVEGDDLYRHSKWLAFMERRLLLAKELLDPDESVLIVAIDEKEVLRLGLLLEQTFPDATTQMVTTSIKPSGSQRSGEFSRVEEYLFFVMLGDARPASWTQDMMKPPTTSKKPKLPVTWHGLRRRGSTDWRRSHRPNGFYPVFVNRATGELIGVGDPLAPNADRAVVPAPAGAVALWPLDPNGEEGRWQISPERFREQHAEGTLGLKSVDFGAGSASVVYLKSGDLEKVREGVVEVAGRLADGRLDIAPGAVSDKRPKTMWVMSSHDASTHGTALLSRFTPGRAFPFPKSLYAVEDALRFFVGTKKSATVLDFFAGSGTTAHALMRLNRQDGGRRKSISITNNEVAASEQRDLVNAGLRPGDERWEALGICEHITKPRICAAVEGKTPEGDVIDGSYRFTDEFPMAEGLYENVEFFALTYEAPLRVSSNREFRTIAPLLWLRAGAKGRRIESLASGWDVADTYGVISDLDKSDDFLAAVNERVRTVFIVTDEDRLFEATVAELPDHAEPVRLYESYLRNFEIEAGRSVR